MKTCPTLHAEEIAIWNTICVRIHSKDCRMARTVNPRNSIYSVDQEGVADLFERGFKITRCKCTKGSE